MRLVALRVKDRMSTVDGVIVPEGRNVGSIGFDVRVTPSRRDERSEVLRLPLRDGNVDTFRYGMGTTGWER